MVYKSRTKFKKYGQKWQKPYKKSYIFQKVRQKYDPASPVFMRVWIQSNVIFKNFV